MKTDCYEKLRTVLDKFPTSFPKTEDKLEIQFLKTLFSQVEAEIAACLPIMNSDSPPKNIKQVADETGMDKASVDSIMNAMEKKGLIISIEEDESQVFFLIPFSPGILDFTHLFFDKEAARLYEEYHFGEHCHEWVKSKIPAYKIIPVKETVSAQTKIQAYQDVVKMINDAESISVSHCACRTQKKLIGEGCDKPTEACIYLNAFADHGIKIGVARKITKEEAIEIVSKMEELGCFHTALNSQTANGICNCCPCCCDTVHMYQKTQNTNIFAKSDYKVIVESELCSACDTCIDMCGFGAPYYGENGSIWINSERCSGCGICVRACPTNALSLEEKTEEEKESTPQDAAELFSCMGWRK